MRRNGKATGVQLAAVRADRVLQTVWAVSGFFFYLVSGRRREARPKEF